jgi:hypothetical protein
MTPNAVSEPSKRAIGALVEERTGTVTSCGMAAVLHSTIGGNKSLIEYIS